MGFRGALVALALSVVGLLGPAVGRAAPRLTPVRPATLVNTWVGGVTYEAPHTDRLRQWMLTVAPGGRSGMVRLRVRIDGRTSLSRWVRLPAKAGTYSFPAPDVRWDSREGTLGIDQRTGGHAIIVGGVDGCAMYSFPLMPAGCGSVVLRYYLGPDFGQVGEPSLSRGGSRLALAVRTTCRLRRCRW